MNDNIPRFTKNLNVILYDRGLKLKDLAKKIDVPYSTLHYQVNHPTALQEQTLKKIAEVLNVDINSLNTHIYQYENLSDSEILQKVQDGFFQTDNFTITIPFISQKLSAGTGFEHLSDADIDVQTIDILASMAKGLDKSTLVAAKVKGDSMIDANINSGDIAIFSRGLINGEGIYVINYFGDVLIKRITFDPKKNEVSIISANKNYPVKIADANDVLVLGKVIGWFHIENY